MRRHAQQHLALVQRLAHQPEGAVLEIAQAAVDQLGGGRGGAGGEIVLLDQQHAQAAAGGIPGQSGSVDAAADNGEVVVGHRPADLPADSRDLTQDGRLRLATSRTGARESRARPQNSAAIAKSPWLGHIKPVSCARFRAKTRDEARLFNAQCPPPACSSSKATRRRRWPSISRSAEPPAHQGYSNLLRELLPGAIVDTCHPGDPAATLPDGESLAGYDGIAITGSSLHVYNGGAEVMRQIDLVRAALSTGTPLFGSCWGLQVITAAAGGSVRKNPKGREIGFGRGIRLTEAGRKHPMYVGKLDVFNAPTVHLDEVEALPAGATVLATNAVSAVQSVEIRTNGSVAWGVQYHPEYPLREIAAIVRRIGTRLIEEGFFKDARRHQDLRARSRYARPRPRLQAAVLAARHQQERARQEAAGRRGGELDRIPGAADAGEARARLAHDPSMSSTIDEPVFG